MQADTSAGSDTVIDNQHPHIMQWCMFNLFLSFFAVVDILALRRTSMKVFLTQVDQSSPAHRRKLICPFRNDGCKMLQDYWLIQHSFWLAHQKSKTSFRCPAYAANMNTQKLNAIFQFSQPKGIPQGRSLGDRVGSFTHEALDKAPKNLASLVGFSWWFTLVQSKKTPQPQEIWPSKAWLGMMVVHDLLIRPYFFWGWHWGVTLKLPWWTYSANLFRGIRFPSSYSLPFVEGNLFDNGTKILEVICPHSRPLLVRPCHCLSCSKGLSISIRMWFAKDGSCTKAPVIESFRSPSRLARFQGTRKKPWAAEKVYSYSKHPFSGANF